MRILKFDKVVFALLLAFSGASEARAGFLDTVIRGATAPVRIVEGAVSRNLPKVIGPTIGKPMQSYLDITTDALSNPIQTARTLVNNARDSGNLAAINLANPQFIELVMGIKALNASGAIHDNNECLQAAAHVTSAVFGVTGDPIQSQLTSQLGAAACGTAVPNTPPPAGVVQVPLNPNIPVPPQAQQALGTFEGFGNFQYQRRPVSYCTIFPTPYNPVTSGFAILSDFSAAQWTGASWTSVAQLSVDGSGLFFLLGPDLSNPYMHFGFTWAGDVYMINNMTGMLAYPYPLAHCA